jgi:hypothetical protein
MDHPELDDPADDHDHDLDADALALELAQTKLQRDAARAQRDAARTQRDEARAQRDEARDQRDEARAQRDHARVQRDRVGGTATAQPGKAWIERRPFAEEPNRWANDPSTVLILTHQKAGTHYLRFFLANYLTLLDDPGAPAVTYERLQELMPNVRSALVSGAATYAAPRTWEARGFREVMFSHVADPVLHADDHAHLGRKIVATRHPLDYLISIWHYNYTQRPDPARRATPLDDVLEVEMGKYAAQVTYLRALARARPATTFATTYERMIATPEPVFRDLVGFLGLPLAPPAFAAALERSSWKAIRAQEEARGRSIVADIDGFFTRAGGTGQWREALTAAQIDRVRAVLAPFDLDVDAG